MNKVCIHKINNYFKNFSKEKMIKKPTLPHCATKPHDMLMGLTLTKRSQDGVYMAGFPYHALDTYLPRLVRKGYRVAICDQFPKVEQNVAPSEALAPKKRGRKLVGIVNKKIRRLSLRICLVYSSIVPVVKT